MKSKLLPGITFMVLLVICQSAGAQNVIRQFRGSVAGNHIQMTLTLDGSNVTGTYSYDRVGQPIKLTGTLTKEGKLELTEFAEKNKPTGKFSCKQSFEDPDRECYWSKPDGSGEAFVTLNEQSMAHARGLEIVPKLITNRARGIVVSYPQLASTAAPLSTAAQNFNRRMLAMTQKAISEFSPIDGKGSFDTNYTVQLGTLDLISVEMMEYSDGGGAHPNDRWWALTYDLAADKEVKFEDLFKAGSDYQSAIARYLTDDINRRAVELEKENARKENRPATRQDEPLISSDQLTEVSDFALTPKGVIVYFDFPHVIAYFDKNFVPFSVLKDYLRPGGAAARLQ